MTKLPEKLRLRALAEEDIYFAKRDRELIKALHERKLAKHLSVDSRKAKTLQKEYAEVTEAHRDRPKKLAKNYRRLIRKAWKLVFRR
jgi:hypothetical protein